VPDFNSYLVKPCPICGENEYVMLMVDEVTKVYTLNCLLCELGTFQTKTIQEARNRWDSWRRK